MRVMLPVTVYIRVKMKICSRKFRQTPCFGENLQFGLKPNFFFSHIFVMIEIKQISKIPEQTISVHPYCTLYSI